MYYILRNKIDGLQYDAYVILQDTAKLPFVGFSILLCIQVLYIVLSISGPFSFSHCFIAVSMH